MVGPTGAEALAGVLAEDAAQQANPLNAPADAIPYVSGRWYPAGSGAVLTGVAMVAGSIRAYPFRLRRSVRISELCARVVTTHAANNFQVAIYANNSATNLPTGSELAKTSNLPTDAAGAQAGDVTDVTLAAGIYWGCINTSSATATFQATASASRETHDLTGATTAVLLMSGAAVANRFVTTPVAFGTWGNLTAAVWTEVNSAAHAALGFRVA